MIHVPEIDQLTQARRVSEIEQNARELIAVSTGQPSTDVAVRIVNMPEPPTDVLRRVLRACASVIR